MARGEGRERAEHFSLAEKGWFALSVSDAYLSPVNRCECLSVGSPGRGGGGALLHHVL